MTKTTCPDFIVGILDEMEYEMLNTNLVTVTLTCDFCPNTWEFNAPADYYPNAAAELMCESCADEWSDFVLGGEDAYLDSYWESLTEM